MKAYDEVKVIQNDRMFRIRERIDWIRSLLQRVPSMALAMIPSILEIQSILSAKL